MNDYYASSGSSDQPMSTGTKILIALGGLSVFGVLAYMLFGRNKITPITQEQAAASSAEIALPMGAVDAEDEATVKAMVNVINTSPIKDCLKYLASILKNFMNGGKDARSSEYDLLEVNGVKVVPKSSALVAAFWSSIYPLYTTDVKGAAPASGKTQEEADAAYNVAHQLAKMWEDYKYSKQSQIF